MESTCGQVVQRDDSPTSAVNCLAFVLARNEEANIRRCLVALSNAGISPVVLDSHSTDGTADAARACGAQVELYDYTNHHDALEYICCVRTERGLPVMVLDADMVVSRDLLVEALELLQDGSVDVIQAPVAMCWEGTALRHGSLYPPKPFLFRGGQHYFVPAGHGERLRPDVRAAQTRNRLVHDDRKPFRHYLLTQLRYADNLLTRASAGRLTLRDRLRLRTPLLILLTPLVSLFGRGGTLDGRAGLGYALDRLIAEAIMLRQSLARERK